MSTNVQFSEVEALLDRLPTTWIGDSEANWYRYAWRILGEAGHSRAESDDERHMVQVHAIALWALTKTFFVHAFSEGYDTDWDYEVGEAIGQTPLLPRIWLVQRVVDDVELAEYTEEHGNLPADGGFDVEVSMELRQLVLDAATDVAATLSKSLGEARLFASLWAAGPYGDDPYQYPLAIEAVDDVTNSPTEGKNAAFAWVSDGMGLSSRDDRG
ncbi:hypothetical protein [Nocardia asteroides]|uniref:hypothetical protein n=1 Tax=Nocardia asteroides TaxID=1824 RepID=UPI003652A093